MVLFKEKKSRNKIPQMDLRITLDAEHTNTIKHFNDTNKNINKKYKKMSQLKLEYDQLNSKPATSLSDIELENKMQLKEDIELINQEINTIETYSNINKYLMDTSHMLYQYYDEDRINTKKKIKKKKNNESINKNISV